MSVRSELRAAALERDGYRCQWPGCSESGGQRLEMAHLVQSSQGGPDTLENVVMLCKAAHHDWLDNRQHTVKGRREMNRELLVAWLS